MVWISPTSDAATKALKAAVAGDVAILPPPTEAVGAPAPAPAPPPKLCLRERLREDASRGPKGLRALLSPLVGSLRGAGGARSLAGGNEEYSCGALPPDGEAAAALARRLLPVLRSVGISKFDVGDDDDNDADDEPPTARLTRPASLFSPRKLRRRDGDNVEATEVARRGEGDGEGDDTSTGSSTGDGMGDASICSWSSAMALALTAFASGRKTPFSDAELLVGRVERGEPFERPAEEPFLFFLSSFSCSSSKKPPPLEEAPAATC